jgi:hypothetical protein
MAYREAQIFFWDSASLANATEAAIARVDVFVKSRPAPINNQSGITNPGATMFIVPTVNSIPDLTNILNSPRTRLEYGQLPSTSDANTAATFEFSPPVILTTNKDYAFVIHYDGDEAFDLWKDISGETLVGTTQISSGHPQRDVETYFTFCSTVPTVTPNTATITNSDMVTSGSLSNTAVANTSYSISNWTAVTGSVLKFNIYAARYAFNGDRNLPAYINATTVANSVITTSSNAIHNTASGSVEFTIPSARYEYVIYDRNVSFLNIVHTGERCFQRHPMYPNEGSPKRVSCVTNSDIIVCPDNNFNFSDHFIRGGLEKEHIVCWSKNHDGQGQDRVHVREVVEVLNNFAIRVDEPCVFTNLSCFWHKSAVATVDSLSNTMAEGTNEALLTLKDSSANDTVRFTNHCFQSVSITVNGNGYNNTDYIVFNGFEQVTGAVVGGFPATANVITDGNGAIQQVYFSDLGCGFINTAAISFTVYSQFNVASNGANFAMTYNIGAVYRSEELGHCGFGGRFSSCRLTDIDIDESGWIFDMYQPSGSFYTAQHLLPYYKINNANTISGTSTHCDGDNDIDVINICNSTFNDLRSLATKKRCLPSWSNEWHTCYEANGSVCNAAGGSQNSVVSVPPGTSNCSVLLINTISNGDFSSILIAPNTTSVTMHKYIINDDYTNEHTNQGNALAKGIETKVTFANDHFAEDLIVYLTAYRPSNTDIEIYARIYNSHDGDAFDDKDWTRLQVTDGNTIFSSVTNSDDFIEITYGFQPSPNVAATFTGSVTTQLGNAVIAGSNTVLNALSVGSLVKIYQPLFPNTYQIAVVSTVTNSTSITLNDTISNNDMVGSGLIIQQLRFPNQAFNNYLNDNVVRYYNTSMVPFDTFNSFQLKVVLLSNSDIVVPRVDDIRAVGTSS